MVEVLIAVQKTILQEGLRTILSNDDDIRVMGVASTLPEMTRLAREQSVEVILLDEKLPATSDHTITSGLRKRDCLPRIVLFSNYENPGGRAETVEQAAVGFLCTEIPPPTIAEAVKAVAQGQERWFVRPTRSKEAAQLSPREKEVMRLMALGLTNQEIAEELHIATSTARKHASNIYDVLGVACARKAIAWAWQSGFM